MLGGGGDTGLAGVGGCEKKSDALLRCLLLGMSSLLKSKSAYRGLGPLCLEDWRGGGGTLLFEVEGRGEEENATEGDLRSVVNEVGGRGECGEAASGGFLIGG